MRTRTIQRSQFNSVPQALKDLDQWVCWKYEQRGDKPTKPPYNARTGCYARTTDKSTWHSFQEAEKAFTSGKYEGIGFVFAATDNFAGIDIDDCVNPVTGEINFYAQGIINKHPTYWEISPSGTGVKGFLKVRSQLDSKRKKLDGIEIELYCSSRYFTVTGKHLPGIPKSVNDCTKAFEQLHQTLSQDTTSKVIHSQGWQERENDPLTDEEILERLFDEDKRGPEWEALYKSGTSSKAASDSQLDFSLIKKLAYYAGKDGHTQIERLAESAALYREKWNSNRGDTTWLRKSIIEACDRLEESTSSQKTTLNNMNVLNSLNILDYVVDLDTVVSTPVKWLWEGWLPAGKLSLLSGDPGLGKTTLALDIAARLSVGKSMPHSSNQIEPGMTLILTAEDDLADTIKPRLCAANGEPSMVKAMLSVPSKQGENIYMRLPSLPEDIEALRTVITEYDVKLVIIDPMMAYLSSRIDAHKDQDIRRAFGELKSVAETTGAAIWLIRHLNKSNGSKAVYAGGGSIGITGSVRSEIMCMKDPNNENGRILVLAKSNLSQIKGGLKFHLESPDKDTVAHVEWDGTTNATADELVSQTVSKSKAVDCAVEFLKNFLADGPKLSTEVSTEARLHSISERSTKAAKEALGVKSVFTGKVWRMCLPDVSAIIKEGSESTDKEVFVQARKRRIASTVRRSDKQQLTSATA